MLQNINLKIKRGELVAIIGKSGSGKTALLLSILGELHNRDVEGYSLMQNPEIAFVSQSPWIRNDTLRKNILFGRSYDKQLYQRALLLSALQDDIKAFNKGDDIILGDKGVSLSGGQRVRLALARAAYADKELLLLDDVLSALD